MSASIDVVAKFAQALDFAHEQGTIHRDVKLHDVMVDTHGQPCPMEFGLARIDQAA